MTKNPNDSRAEDQVLYQRGRDSMDSGDYDSAIRLFDRSAHLQPHFKTLELLGECLMMSGEPSKAIIPLAASVGLGTKPYRALYLLAQALEASGDHENAIDKLNEALGHKPDFKSAAQLLQQLQAHH